MLALRNDNGRHRAHVSTLHPLGGGEESVAGPRPRHHHSPGHGEDHQLPTADRGANPRGSLKRALNTHTRVPGSSSHINRQHMPYQYCSAAPMEANVSYLVSICDVVRAAATCEQMQNSQKYNFQTNFQRVPGSSSHINPQHIPYQYCRAAPIEVPRANASYFVSI